MLIWRLDGVYMEQMSAKDKKSVVELGIDIKRDEGLPITGEALNQRLGVPSADLARESEG